VMKKPRVIFMGKDKQSVIDAFFNSEMDIAAVVMPYDSEESYKKSSLYNFSEILQIPFYTDKDIYYYLDGEWEAFQDIDLVISYLFPKKIKSPLIKLPKLGCINFHSAPLPKYRGWGVYNVAILNNEKQWGVSAHFVDENFDTGDIIKVNYFDIDPKKETAHSLEKKSQEQLLKLFNEVIGMVANGEKLPRIPQKQEDGVTYTKKDTLVHELIRKSDSDDLIDRKIRAFWFPPFSARIVLNDKSYPLINQEILDSLAKTW
jgi:methionyl-tRNA formyltransferase